jgi:hypothetical protein
MPVQTMPVQTMPGANNAGSNAGIDTRAGFVARSRIGRKTGFKTDANPDSEPIAGHGLGGSLAGPPNRRGYWRPDADTGLPSTSKGGWAPMFG